jgi:hypothetical protein
MLENLIHFLNELWRNPHILSHVDWLIALLSQLANQPECISFRVFIEKDEFERNPQFWGCDVNVFVIRRRDHVLRCGHVPPER